MTIVSEPQKPTSARPGEPGLPVSEPNPRHYHIAWAGVLTFTIEGLRVYRELAAKVRIECHWHTIRTLEALRALHRRLLSAARKAGIA